MDDDELEITEELRADLKAFAERWEASISDQVFDDRWDSNPVMNWLVGARYAMRRILNPSAQKRAVAEDAEMRSLGKRLRDRLQDELGSDYKVIYEHQSGW